MNWLTLAAVLYARIKQAERALAEARAEGVHQQHKYAEAADEISTLRTQLHAAQEALEKYADRNNYDGSPSAIDMDDGQHARDVLAALSPRPTS